MSQCPTSLHKLFLIVFLPAIVFSANAQESKESGIGVGTGYSYWFLRDELQSIRNFSGITIPVRLSFFRNHSKKTFLMEGSYQKTNLSADTSPMTAGMHTGQLNVVFQRRISNAGPLEVEAGVFLTNQFSARTYSFNSPFAGQDPFTGEFFTSPAAVLTLGRALGAGSHLSWQIHYSPLAYLFSRDHHPIRGFPTFGDVPRGMVLLPDFHDFQSTLRFSEQINLRVNISFAYRWRYMQYRRGYLFQAANHQLEVGFNIKLDK